MRERTRRWCCRAGFLLLCVAPAVATMALAVARHMPALATAKKSKCEALWSDRLGLAVAMDRLSFPRFNAALVEGLRLSDPETGVQVARARLLEVAKTGGRTVMLAYQPELEAGQLPLLWTVLHERILRAPCGPWGASELTAREATVHAARRSQTFRDVRCVMQSGASGRQVSCDFRLVGANSGEPVRLRIVRDRQAPTPTTRWLFHTGATPLPCAPLAPHIKGLGALGDRCKFQGRVCATQTNDGWSGDISGRLDDVDLDRLVTDRFPHKLSGVAQVVINRAAFDRGRVTSAAGSLDSPGGVVSRSLLTAAAESLHWTSSRAIHDTEQPLWQYRRLAFAFALDNNGLVIAGRCQAPSPGAILVDSRDALLADPPEPVVSALALVRTLAPQNEILVPASKETDALLHALPLPNVIPPAASTARPPYCPLRLR